METVLATRRELPHTSPFGDGNAAEKIVETIRKDFLSA
jgi:UDP-N-acetylglucosamine 2-epimerase